MKGRRLRRAALVLAMILAVAFAYAWQEARRLPVVRRITLPFPCCGPPPPPLRILFLSDIHIDDLDFSRRRLERIVARANALRPDLVLIAGDFVGGAVQKGAMSKALALAPLRGLRPRLGTIAVPGNHDHWGGVTAVEDALRQAGVTVLVNRAIRRGGLTIGGVDDDFTGHADLPGTLRAMKALGGPGLLLSHSPDIFSALPATGMLALAGHTHCGQIVFPLVGALYVPSRYGNRFVCGIYRKRGKAMIVTAGTGNSIAPIRLGAPPEMWLIEFFPPLRGLPQWEKRPPAASDALRHP